MSQKAIVIEMHEAGKDYDEIEKATGAKRTYIRTIISQHKKTPAEGGVDDEENESENQEAVNNGGMDFRNDLEGSNNLAGGKMEGAKTGKEYHKAWVDEKAFECACGCTLNRKSTYCPNCGTILDWSGL